jgi:nucleotide-binding universal stress UspA family protein
LHLRHVKIGQLFALDRSDAMAHILFPFDFSSQSLKAATFVSAMARCLGARITIVSVVPPAFDGIPSALADQIGEDPAKWKRALQSRLDRMAIPELDGMAVERTVDAGDPGYRITEFAHGHAVDLIMMPTHGVGRFRSLLIGSATAKVLHDARCPVWTAAHMEIQHAQPAPRTILCALAAGAEDVALLRWAADFGQRVGATLKLLHVVNPISDWPALERERVLLEQVREEAQQRVLSTLATVGVDAPLRIAVGLTAATVAEQACEENADLIVIGRGTLPASLGRLRTHTFAIIQQSSCPVLSV